MKILIRVNEAFAEKLKQDFLKFLEDKNEVKGVKDSIHYKLFDKRGIRYDASKIPNDSPKLNPITFELFNDWEDGFYLLDVLFSSDTMLINVRNNKVISKNILTDIDYGYKTNNGGSNTLQIL